MNAEKNNDILPKTPVKGMTSMAHVHPCFKVKKVLQYLGSLIIDNNYKYIDELSDEEKAELTAILIEAGGRDAEHECIVESPDFELTINSFKSYLSSNKAEDAEKFLYAIRDNAINYYETLMKDIFNFVLQDYHRERQEWLDYVAKNGDPDDARDRYLDQLYCV